MIRSGRYGTYKGKEYEINYDMEENLLVLSQDPNSIKCGFKDKYNSGLFTKIVNPDEVKNCYQVKTKGKIKGEIVNISNERENEYYIGTSDARIAKKLGMERTDKYYYESWVPKNEVEIFEEVKEIKLN
ncbi:hypothetical protein ABEV04_05020 [Heyndrickxia faecalis]|uniref:hypothetical protein n=2 Tax=Bacillaceae TaxID=186817 RepID=UPI002E1EE40E|nr:hypothetical protein [Weizmannia sp. CD-2023]